MAIIAPYLPYEKLREVADTFFREHHPSGVLPIPIERIVEFEFQLDIVPVPGLLDDFDVDAFITADLTEIRVDRFIHEKRPTRYRFSLAHELAHVLIHQDIFEKLQFTSIKEWKAAMASIPEDQYAWIEWQAYALGGLLLVPANALKSLFEEKCKEASRAGADLQEIDIDARRIVESHMGKYFEVSADVIAKRMNKDKLWR
jgi:hypothetical protein